MGMHVKRGDHYFGTQFWIIKYRYSMLEMFAATSDAQIGRK